MPITSAHPMHDAYKAAVSHERFTMDTPVYVQRDQARAEAAQCWQEIAELREMLKRAIGLLGFASAGFAPGSNARSNSERCIADARTLLARAPA